MALYQLAVILPCYNPKPGWEENVISSYNELKVLTNINTILLCVVNDGSIQGITDKEINKIKTEIKDCIYISYNKNMGKGYALRKGFQNISAEKYIYTDIDFPYEMKSMFELYKALEVNDLVIAIRNTNYYKQLPLIRKIISKVLQVLIKTFFNMPVSDTQGGLKAFNEKGKELFLKTRVNRYLFDMEFIYYASESLKTGTIEAGLRPGIHFSGMNFKILFMESFNFFKILLTKNK